MKKLIEKFMSSKVLSCDSETTGLERDNRLFSIQVSDGVDAIYLDIRRDSLDLIRPLFKQDILFCFFNASFDLQKLAMEGIHPKNVIEVKELCRIAKSNFMVLSLDMALKHFLKIRKNDEVKIYMKEHKLKSYADVPIETMERYGKDDAIQTFQLYEHVKGLIPEDLHERTRELTPILFKMGQRGVKVDIETIERFRRIYQNKLAGLVSEIETLAGTEFKNGPKWLKAFFDANNVPYEIKESTGNPKFAKASLEKINHPLAQLISEKRHYEHFIANFFKNMLHYGASGTLNAYADSAGAETGRFSYRNPNLMNIPKDKREVLGQTVALKEAFIARDGYKFASIDFSQQEFRLLLDFANQKNVIKDVMNGADVHQSTADQMKVARRTAKTINFAILYGVGDSQLSKMLGISLEEAKGVRFKYFQALPRVENYINYVRRQATKNRKIKNPTGRYLLFPNKDFSYAAPNYLIQGFGADIMKDCIILIDKYIVDNALDIHILLTIHDEVLLEFRGELASHLDKIAEIMRNSYTPRNGLEMDTDINIGDSNWSESK